MKKFKSITVKYTFVAPVSHIGESSGVGSYFQALTTSCGKIPTITGNSVRGILRDRAAEQLMDAAGVKVNIDVFDILFSGGNISGSTKNDIERAKQIREHFPFISMFGGALGTMMMSGNFSVGFLYPICKEAEPITNTKASTSWHNWIDDIEFTRMDDSKDYKKSGYIENHEEERKAKASTQMRTNVQYISPGAQFLQRIDISSGATELEVAALYSALYRWFQEPYLGGMKSKGFGRFDAESDGISVTDGVVECDDYVKKMIEKYEKFLQEDHPAEWLYLLDAAGGKKK